MGTGAGAEYATALRAEAMATDMSVSDEWIKKNFTQLETFLKADDEENYRCILTNTDYAYITIFELVNALVEKNSTSCLDGFRILAEFHEKLAKTVSSAHLILQHAIIKRTPIPSPLHCLLCCT